MLNICHEFCAEFGLSFNPRKSKTMVFGKNYSSSRASLFLSDEPIQFVNEWKYLGVIVLSGKTITFSPKVDLCNFYASFNSLYNVYTRPSETVLMFLLYTTCIPNLTYASEVKE